MAGIFNHRFDCCRFADRLQHRGIAEQHVDVLAADLVL